MPSMGARLDCYGNTITESFFATLECDLLRRSIVRTHAEARTAPFDYIEGIYNPHRRHSALGYHTQAARSAMSSSSLPHERNQHRTATSKGGILYRKR